MKKLTRNDILKADDAQVEDVPVPEWGGAVTVKGLSGTERDEYESSILQMVGDKMVPTLENARAKLVVRSIIDENGAPMFTADDIEQLGSKSARALQRVFDKARELSGLKDEDIKELVQGLKPTPDKDSTSD